MKSEQEIRKMLEELLQRTSHSANMNYERGGAIDALKWVLGDSDYLVVGYR